jgi:hypothetical protein
MSPFLAHHVGRKAQDVRPVSGVNQTRSIDGNGAIDPKLMKRGFGGRAVERARRRSLGWN